MVMRLIVGIIMALFFVSSLIVMVPAFAQDQPSSDEHQPPSADQIVSMMQTKLNLTPDQVTAITPIIEKYSSKREELRQSMEDGTADRDGIRSQMKQLKSDEGQELGQVLSADQISQWQQMMSKGRHKHSDDQAQPNGSDGTGHLGEGGGNNDGASGSGE